MKRKCITGTLLLLILGLVSCKINVSTQPENPDINEELPGENNQKPEDKPNNPNEDNTGGSENKPDDNVGDSGDKPNNPDDGENPDDGDNNENPDINVSDPSWDNINSSDSINIIEASGHLESAYIKWTGVKNATGYNVYYKEKDATEYIKLDGMLVRMYSDYLRADVVGIKSGSYTLKINPVFDAVEGEDFATANVTVAAHDRSGFSFSTVSTIKDSSGAYNSDGTLKKNAQVIYVTKDNAKTVTATVNGAVQTGLQTILDAKQKKNTSNDILCIRIIGTVSLSDLDHISSSSEGLQIKGAAANTNMNITVEGIGDDATFNGFGVLIRNCGNVEIRNLGFINYMDDGISIDTGNTNLWIHNNDFFYGNAGGDADQAKGDGSLDIKKSYYITVSYNHFWDSGKSCLLDASTGSGSDYITYHHNWFDHSDSRHPRVRNAKNVHVYNNYYDGVSKYGIGAAGGGSSVFSEANYFRNTKYPLLTSQQGSDIATDSKGTFSGEDGGVIKSYNDVMIGGTFVAYSSINNVDYDAYVASTRNEIVPTTVISKKGGYTYSNFDTSDTMYDYLVQSAEDAKNTVEMYAGRINNGDLQYEFNDSVEDYNYDIIKELKSMVVNYKSSLIKVLGTVSNSGNNDSDSEGSGDNENPDNQPDNSDNEVIAGTVTHNFTESGKTSDVFNITGNLSSSKGTATYNNETLTQCLKIESSTNITFTVSGKYTLILVFGDSETGNIKVDGTKLTSDSSVLTVEVEEGTHTITKADTRNLYYIVLIPIE